MAENRKLTVREVADRMNVTTTAVYNWIKAGLLPTDHVRKGLRSVMVIPEEAVKKLEEEHHPNGDACPNDLVLSAA